MKSWSLAVIAAVLGCVFSSPEASAADKLSKVFKLDMLNVQPAFLESVAGPAKEINKDANGVEIRRYLVDGCDVAAHFEGSRARRYSLSLTPKCNFNLGGFVPGYSSTKGLTIGKFVDGPQHPKMRMHSFCIYSCGNAADPTIDFYWEGPRSVNSVYIALTAVIAGESSLDASEALTKLMLKNEGEDYLIDTKFNCDQKYDEKAIREFMKVPVTEIVVGLAGKGPCS